MVGSARLGFTNTASGNLNKRQDAKHKQIDLHDLDVEMLSPQFLQFKTLKRPLREQDISLARTNPNGVRTPAHRDDEEPSKEYPTSVIFKKDEPRTEKKKEQTVSLIDMSGLNIKPAYKTNNYLETPLDYGQPTTQKDSNTILSAMMRKGLKPEVAVKPDVLLPKEEKKVGPAEAKLKALMKKNQPQPQLIKETKPTLTKPTRKEEKKSEPSQIGEEIPEDFEDQYGNEQFEKVSGAYESAIRQSLAGDSGIRQSIAGESMIKESIAGESLIRQSIRESIRESLAGGSSSRIRESIREDIRQSLNESGRSMKEEIIEEMSASLKKSKESIQEVYEEIFEEESLSNSLSKSQNKFKRSNVKETDSLSQSASKSFRMKTNIAKSLRFAEQIRGKDKEIVLIDDKKINESLTKQKSNLNRIKQNVAKLMNQKKEGKNTSEKNKDLYYNFKVEINRLITSDNFQSKLKKLSAFLSIGSDIAPNKEYVNQLEQGILRNVMIQVQNMRVGKSNLDQMQKMRKEYDDKLKQQLKIQEINLRAEMNQKISEKDSELKKMIAELQSRMMGRTVERGSYGAGLPSSRAEQYEVDSDYSIDSDNISWKADLWELLPEFEKKKLYEKQTAEVTKFLADVMVNELKEEALERSLDISFEFPEEYNNLDTSHDSKASSKTSKSHTIESHSWQKPNFTKKQPEVKHDRSDYLADLPKLNIKKPASNESLNISSSSKEEVEVKFQKTRKDQKLKPQIIRILSDYKNLYLKKKQQVVRKILKVLSSKDANSQKYLYSSLQQIPILSEKQYKKDHQLYIRAYEQEMLWNLVGIYNRSLNKKPTSVEKEMINMYERLVVVSQVATADKFTERIALDVEKDAEYNVEALTKDAIRQMEFAPCAIEIIANEQYMELKTKREEKLIQGELVEHIVSILSAEFAKEFPKRKK